MQRLHKEAVSRGCDTGVKKVESVWIALCVALGLLALLFLGCLVSLQNSIQEVADGLDEKLMTDTNTLISISSGNRKIRLLAGQINRQLIGLRTERLNLQQGDRELKAAITNISHDLRTPLTAICGYLDLLEQEALSPKAEQYLEVVRERTGAMRALTEELLQYSVIASREEELHMEQVCVNDILEQSLAGFYGVFMKQNVVPDIRMTQVRIMRMLDKAAMRRIFDNILSNAARYTDGDLTVRLFPDGKIVFSNHASRLDRVEAKRLFEKFYTVESAKNSTGLGLSIAKLLTEKMGGQVRAEYDKGILAIQIEF